MPKCNVCGNEMDLCTCPKGLGSGGEDEAPKEGASEKGTFVNQTDLELARERMQQFKDSMPCDLSKIGKIVLLCGTSTAGKTSICTAAQTEAVKSGHTWVVDGADVAAEQAWKEESKVGGVSYLSGEDHFINAMKTHAEPSVVDAAEKVFRARTLAVALFSKPFLGNPKVPPLDLTPEADLKAQSIKINAVLSPEDKAKYTPEAIENLLTIIQKCPDETTFFKQHAYPPLEQLNENMLERAIARAKKGESTILDVIGNETVGEQSMVDYLSTRLEVARLPAETSSVVVAHCPVATLIERIENRNKEAMDAGREEDVRQAFFPFDQYGAIYERAADQSDPANVGVVTRQDIIKAADTFGRGEEDAQSLLTQLGFTGSEESIAVKSRVQNDEVFQTGNGELSPQEIAERLCERSFVPNSNNQNKVHSHDVIVSSFDQNMNTQMEPLPDSVADKSQDKGKGALDEDEVKDNFRPL